LAFLRGNPVDNQSGISSPQSESATLAPGEGNSLLGNLRDLNKQQREWGLPMQRKTPTGRKPGKTTFNGPRKNKSTQRALKSRGGKGEKTKSTHEPNGWRPLIP